MEKHDTDMVRTSFGRCTLTDEFLVTFYNILTQSSADVARMFAHTDMPRQRRLLKEALIYLISYPAGNEFSQQRVIELGNSHSRAGLNVRPELYDIWVDSLIKSIRRHDEQFSPALEAAWRRVLAPGIAAMTALYDT